MFVLEDFTLPACALPRLRDDVRFEYGLFHDLEEAEALQDVGNLGDSMQWPGRERDPFSIYLGVNAVHVPEERFYEFRESEWAAKDELLNLIEQMYLLGVAGHDGEKKRILAAMRARVLIDRLWRRE